MATSANSRHAMKSSVGKHGGFRGKMQSSQSSEGNEDDYELHELYPHMAQPGLFSGEELNLKIVHADLCAEKMGFVPSAVAHDYVVLTLEGPFSSERYRYLRVDYGPCFHFRPYRTEAEVHSTEFFKKQHDSVTFDPHKCDDHKCKVHTVMGLIEYLQALKNEPDDYQVVNNNCWSNARHIMAHLIGLPYWTDGSVPLPCIAKSDFETIHGTLILLGLSHGALRIGHSVVNPGVKVAKKKLAKKKASISGFFSSF